MPCFAARLSGLIVVDGSGETGERSGGGDEIDGPEVGDISVVKEVIMAVETRAWTGLWKSVATYVDTHPEGAQIAQATAHSTPSIAFHSHYKSGDVLLVDLF